LTAASNINVTEATLNGTVNPAGYGAWYRFEYGTTSSYGSSAPVASGYAGSANGVGGQSVTIGGLKPGTTYHYRITASNSVGTSYGADRTFTLRGGSHPVVVRDASTGAAWVYHQGSDGGVWEIYRNPATGWTSPGKFAGSSM
jgi:phosphodiesterase/alkaline phosphatase D-like protein